MGTSMGSLTLVRSIILLSIIIRLSEPWVSVQPRNNIWVTLANVTGQEHMCLSVVSAGNPFTTCLVGIPLRSLEYEGLVNRIAPSVKNGTGAMDQWDGWMWHVLQTDLEPQELNILGCVTATACLQFNYTGMSKTLKRDITASLAVYQNGSMWCNYTSPNISKSTNAPLLLPAGIFLICGDRAWQGIPSHVSGGPTLGRLTLLTPNTSMIFNITRILRKQKREIHKYQDGCNDKLDFWQADKTALTSFLAPGVAAAQALTSLNKLGCWLAKQNNATSAVLSALLTDVDSIRHATLRNRAAIDFLLLVQGHGCEEFEGMCCMNLSDHSQTIYQQIKSLQDLTDKLKTSSIGFESWLTSLGIEGWLKELIKVAIIILIIIVVLLIILPCLLQCLQKMISKWMQLVWLIETKKGGNVGDQYADDLDLINTSLN
ncbi:hypothetical protein QYF61_012998 [Mycteria americana]|uniref:Envelope protein n=1 Tax=Mycteria americana TaxID=33587 RepID=A0AAN7N959_MYCAM|nr:hypothetical protein QYF61_012998 [Mycteria americana]